MFLPYSFLIFLLIFKLAPLFFKLFLKLISLYSSLLFILIFYFAFLFLKLILNPLLSLF